MVVVDVLLVFCVDLCIPQGSPPLCDFDLDTDDRIRCE